MFGVSSAQGLGVARGEETMNLRLLVQALGKEKEERRGPVHEVRNAVLPGQCEELQQICL